MTRDEWLLHMVSEWRQGEHAALLGPTGTGKTTLARDLLPIRGWVAAFAVKRFDDTLETFPQHGYVRSGWPPDWKTRRALYWPRPRDLDDILPQRAKVRHALNDIFKNGGWAPFLDDTGFIAGILGLAKEIATFLSQGRSSHISAVCAATQPTSMVQHIPTEVWRQVSHFAVFRYENTRDRALISDITGLEKADIRAWMQRLGKFDFIAVSHGQPIIVRATERVQVAGEQDQFNRGLSKARAYLRHEKKTQTQKGGASRTSTSASWRSSRSGSSSAS